MGDFLTMKDIKWNMLVLAATQKDPDAFDAIVKQKMKTILYYSGRFVHHPAFAEDAAQEVILCMYNSIHSLRDPEAFNVWMHRIILGVCSRMNKKHPTSAYIDEEEDAQMETHIDLLPESAAEHKERQLHISAAVNSLPARQRLALTMFYYDEMTYKEIAQVLGVTVSGVSSTIVKAKKALKTRLSQKTGNSMSQEMLMGMALVPALQSHFQAEANFLGSASRQAALTQKLAETSVAKGAAIPAKASAILAKAAVSATAIALSVGLAGAVLLYVKDVPQQEVKANIEMQNNGSELSDHINPALIELDLNGFEGTVVSWSIKDMENHSLLNGNGLSVKNEQLTLSPGSYQIEWVLEDKNQRMVYVNRIFKIQ